MIDVFLISPVRGIDAKTEEKIKVYVELLERQGKKVHWPKRDTDQNDPVGIRICCDNFAAMLQAREIHVWYDPKSQGSVFDFGGFFMLLVLRSSQTFVVANIGDVEKCEKPGQKSFENVLLALHRGERVSVKIREEPS